MSKVVQYNHLVVFKDERDYIECVEYYKKSALEGKYRYDVRNKALTIKTHMGQNCYHYRVFNDDVERFFMGICRMEFIGVGYLSGDYPSELLNYISTHIRSCSSVEYEV